MKNNEFLIVKLFIVIVLISGYLIPNIEIFNYSAAKLFFLIGSVLFYIAFLKKFTIFDYIFSAILILFAILFKNLNFLMFIYLPLAKKIIEYKELISDYLKKSNILYICLFATIIYTIKYFGENGRYAFSSIHEINQSGLSIFLLGTMLLKKNKKAGIITLLFGLLTFSRSYYLAFSLLIMGKYLKFNFKEKFINKINYFNVTVVSSILLFCLGLFYINQYKLGNITLSDDNLSRIFNLLDYSNLFRFSTVVFLFYILKAKPFLLISGMSNEYYINCSYEYANLLEIPYVKNIPHNLFLSHLKMYGIISIFETVYISIVLSKIVNNSNLMIYLAIIFYSIFLGSGLFNYWLFLTIFALLLSEKEDEMYEKN